MRERSDRFRICEIRFDVVRLFVSWAIACCGFDVFAADNPFGLPRPINPEQPGAVMFHGGVVGGLGGGMSCFPDTMIAENLPDDGGSIKPKLRFGLGLLDGIVVEKDFTERDGRFERLTYLLRSPVRTDRSAPGIDRSRESS